MLVKCFILKLLLVPVLGISDLLYLTCSVTRDFGFRGLIHWPLNFHLNPEQQFHIELELLILSNSFIFSWNCCVWKPGLALISSCPLLHKLSTKWLSHGSINEICFKYNNRIHNVLLAIFIQSNGVILMRIVYNQSAAQLNDELLMIKDCGFEYFSYF